jgi:glycosyltransferase involved in cell wall biosynthesis
MKVLFALYGGLDCNSAIPLQLHARELAARGHHCAVAIPDDAATSGPVEPALRVLRYREALADPGAIFADGPADIVHAWTPREGVRRFVTSYLVKRPTPWIIYLEDNEDWIARTALGLTGLRDDLIPRQTEAAIAARTPEGMANPLHYHAFAGLADAAVVVQRKLAVEVPAWLPWTAVMLPVDLERFAPRAADPALAKRWGVRDGERVIVYPGGLNHFLRPGLEALCRAVGLINREGVACRLLRSGPVPIDFLDRLPPEAAAALTELGVLPREDIPRLVALADVLVQPGKDDAF